MYRRCWIKGIEPKILVGGNIASSMKCIRCIRSRSVFLVQQAVFRHISICGRLVVCYRVLQSSSEEIVDVQVERGRIRIGRRECSNHCIKAIIEIRNSAALKNDGSFTLTRRQR